MRIADLGCGPGNSTQVLRLRWPDAELVGIDSSPQMIDAAKQQYPDQAWQLDDIATWEPPSQYDLVYSNAAFHWLPNHASLLNRLWSFVAHDGALAFQIPSKTHVTIRALIHEVSSDPQWTHRMATARAAMTMESPSFYYDTLSAKALRLDIWETEYFHVMESAGSIVDWIASTGLRPFLSALNSAAEGDRFMEELNIRAARAYETRSDGKVLFPFRRTFVIAYR